MVALACGGDAAEDDDGARLRVGYEEVAVGRGVDDARHDEGAGGLDGELLHVIGALHGPGGVATGVELDLEAGGREGPGAIGPGDDGGAVVDGLGGLGLGQIGDGDLAADAGLLLVVAGEGGFAGDGLLGRERRGEKHGGGNENGGGLESQGGWQSHSWSSRVLNCRECAAYQLSYRRVKEGASGEFLGLLARDGVDAGN